MVESEMHWMKRMEIIYIYDTTKLVCKRIWPVRLFTLAPIAMLYAEILKRLLIKDVLEDISASAK